METHPNKNFVNDDADRQNRFRNGRVMAGLIVVAVGATFLARQLGADIPDWLISLPSLFIVLGLFIGARHGFRDWGWIVLVLVGVTMHTLRFVADDIQYHKLIWPIVIIGVGLIIMVRPRGGKRFWSVRDDRREDRGITPPVTFPTQNTGSSTFEEVNVFGGSNKVIIAKDFRAGEVINIFGGSEVNFMQADFNGRAQIEMVQIFGGTKLIVPPNWHVQTEELVCIFGGVDDKRSPSMLSPDPQKVLILKGTCIFGGIDIRTF